jgi:hypothetical protein
LALRLRLVALLRLFGLRRGRPVFPVVVQFVLYVMGLEVGLILLLGWLPFVPVVASTVSRWFLVELGICEFGLSVVGPHLQQPLFGVAGVVFPGEDVVHGGLLFPGEVAKAMACVVVLRAEAWGTWEHLNY